MLSHPEMARPLSEVVGLDIGCFGVTFARCMSILRTLQKLKFGQSGDGTLAISGAILYTLHIPIIIPLIYITPITAPSPRLFNLRIYEVLKFYKEYKRERAER
jgi:hypothetical protein